MSSVTFISDKKALTDFLKKNPGEGVCFWSWRPLDSAALLSLAEHKLRPVEAPVFDEAFKRKFIAEYSRCMAEMAAANLHRLWWGTDMASKNRYSSKLPDVLEEFLVTHEVMAKTKAPLLVLFPSQGIFSSTEGFSQWKQGLRKQSAFFYNAVMFLLRSVHARMKLASFLKEKIKKDKKYTIVKTFVYDHSFTKEGVYKDTFFGKLPDVLKEEKDVLIFANMIGDFRKGVEAVKKCSNHVVVPLEAFLRFDDILAAVLEYAFTPIKIPSIKFFGHEISGIIRQVLTRTGKGVQCRQFLHYRATRNLLKAVEVENIIMTYENYPWERMFIQAAKEVRPQTPVVGYQHTVVPQAYLNYFFTEEEKRLMPLPDRILTTGLGTKKIMEKYAALADAKVTAACGLRFQYLYNIKPAARRKIQNILVPLEASLESYPMVAYLIEQFKDAPQFVRIRTHPLLPWARFEKKYGIKLPANFTVSTDVPLKDDIETADLLVYWGTTVSMEALLMGKPVIHFDQGNILSFDPLFECPHLKWTAQAGTTLQPLINQIDALSDTEFNAQKEKARGYLLDYFYPINDENLIRFTQGNSREI